MERPKLNKKIISLICCAVLVFFSTNPFFISCSIVPESASNSTPIADSQGAEKTSYTVWTDSGVYYAKDSNGTLVKSSTNASDVINWAMKTAYWNGGGAVQLLGGTYYLKNPLFLQSNVHLQGESSKLTKITVANSTSENGFLNFYALTGVFDRFPIINAEISDLTLDPNSKGTTFSLGMFVAHTRNYYLKVHNCDFPEGGSNSRLNSTAAISLQNSVRAEIYNNVMLNQSMGIYIINTNYTNIHNNYLDKSAWEGFYFDKDCYYNMISGNTFINASYWHPDEHEALQMHGTCKYNIVKDNSFQFCINAIFDEGQTNIISNNSLNVVYNGIYIMPHDGVSEDIVKGNHIQNASHVGIGIQDGSNVIVSSNFLEGDNVSDGLRAYNSHNITFFANNVKSVYNGINLFQSMFCTAFGNEIATSIYGIYEGNGSDYNTIVSNDIYENGNAYAIHISGAHTGARALDAAAISAHWYPGPPIGPLGYAPNFDFNCDGAINVLDAAIISAYWTGPPKGPLAP